MDIFRKIYYLSVSIVCGVLFSTLCVMRLDQSSSFAGAGLFGAGRVEQHADTTVVIKKPPEMLYLTEVSLIGCKTRKDAKLLAKAFAAAGTDSLKSEAAYDAYWKNDSCDVYNNGVSLAPLQVQAAYVTKQASPVKVYLGQEGQVAADAFEPNLYIVMVSDEVFENIFQCEHSVDPESGYDAIESCRPHV